MESNSSVNSEESLPKVVTDAYPLFSRTSVRYVERVVVSMHPDITFDIYIDDATEHIYTHVITDHPDPVRDGGLLKRETSQYDFTAIVSPASQDAFIPLLDANETSDSFFVKNNDTYHYVAQTKLEA